MTPYPFHRGQGARGGRLCLSCSPFTSCCHYSWHHHPAILVVMAVPHLSCHFISLPPRRFPPPCHFVFLPPIILFPFPPSFHFPLPSFCSPPLSFCFPLPSFCSPPLSFCFPPLSFCSCHSVIPLSSQSTLRASSLQVRGGWLFCLACPTSSCSQQRLQVWCGHCRLQQV